MEGTIDVRTKDLLALIVIIDEFEEFNRNFLELLNGSKELNFYKLNKIMANDNVLGNKKLKEFYINNKEIINIINSYSSIYSFIACNYDYTNKKINDSFYELYGTLLNNKDKLNRVIDLLIKIEKLGFERLSFNEDVDFSKKTYHLSMPVLGDEFCYLENMYVIPSYSGGVIDYKTRGSNYEITLSKGMSQKIYPKNILVNSLFFDVKKLPEEISKDTTIDEIMRLRSDVQNQYDILRESINLSIGVDELKDKFNHIYDLANMCDDMKIKAKLLEILDDLKENILEVEYQSEKYKKVISDKNLFITEDKIEEEKKLELKRRINYLYDID